MPIRKKAKGIPKRKDLLPFVSDSECYDVAQAVQAAFPDLTYETGFFVKENGKPADHAWCTALDGTIVDTTYSQFDEDVDVLIAPKNSPIAKRYRSYAEHHPNGPKSFCLLRALGVNDVCQVAGCSYSGIK